MPLKNKQQAKRHAYLIAADHVASFARDINQDAHGLKGEEKDSEFRLAEAMSAIAQSLRQRGQSMKVEPQNSGQ